MFDLLIANASFFYPNKYLAILIFQRSNVVFDYLNMVKFFSQIINVTYIDKTFIVGY